MKNRYVLVLILATLAVAPALFAQNGGNSANAMRFNASMRGNNVNGGAGALNGFGNLFMTLEQNGQATITSATRGLGTITGLTLLQNGTPVLSFTDPTTFRFGQFARTLALDPALAQAIAANPQNFSWQISTSDFPLGAVRGQMNGANTQSLTGTLVPGASGATNGNGTFTMTLTPQAGGTTDQLEVDMNTSGIGNAINQLSLTSPGQAPITFANNTSATNGRLRALTAVTAAQAQQILSNPSAFTLSVNTPQFQNGAVSGTLGMSNDEWIPIVGTVQGAQGTNWKTAINLFNAGVPGSTAASNGTATMIFSPMGGGPSMVASSSLPTNALVNASDISGSTMFPGMNGIGALRIASTGNIFANARIFNDQSAAGRGTFGESVPALTRSRALSQGVLVGLSNVTGTSGQSTGTPTARTNIGLLNPNDTDTDVDLELRDPAGNLLASRIVTVPSGQMIQLPLAGATGLFNTVTHDVPNASVDFLSGAPMFVFGSVVDNTSGDASFIEPEDTSTLANSGM